MLFRSWHDFSGYDLDAPFPDVLHLAQRSFRTQAEAIVAAARRDGLTLRQVVERRAALHPSPFVGSPTSVADMIQEWFEAGAFDGLNVFVSHPAQFRRFVDEVIPILQERGLHRTDYEGTTLREHLGLPFPTNRYAVSAADAEQLPAATDLSAVR